MVSFQEAKEYVAWESYHTFLLLGQIFFVIILNLFLGPSSSSSSLFPFFSDVWIWVLGGLFFCCCSSSSSSFLFVERRIGYQRFKTSVPLFVPVGFSFSFILFLFLFFFFGDGNDDDDVVLLLLPCLNLLVSLDLSFLCYFFYMERRYRSGVFPYSGEKQFLLIVILGLSIIFSISCGESFWIAKYLSIFLGFFTTSLMLDEEIVPSFRVYVFWIAFSTSLNSLLSALFSMDKTTELLSSLVPSFLSFSLPSPSSLVENHFLLISFCLNFVLVGTLVLILCNQSSSPKEKKKEEEDLFSKSKYRRVYKTTSLPEFQHTIFNSVEKILDYYCQKESLSTKLKRDFLHMLQREEGEMKLFEVSDLCQRLWTSSFELNTRKFSSILNELLVRNDVDDECMKHICVICRGIDSFSVNLREEEEDHNRIWPEENVVYRGGSLPDQFRTFFQEQGRKYRCPMYLSTLKSDVVAKRKYCQAAVQKRLPPVLWILRMGEGEKCDCVNYLAKSTPLEEETEFLFPPFSVFVVLSWRWQARPTWEVPHIVELLVVGGDENSKGVPLPCSPWH